NTQNNDLIVGNFASFDLTLLLNDGAGNFTEAANSPIAAPGRPESLAVDDLNQDGALDFVLSTQVQDQVNVFFGISNGLFEAPLLLTDQILPSGVAVGDLDEDGILDVLVTHNAFTLE